jgi:hypothetical protein
MFSDRVSQTIQQGGNNMTRKDIEQFNGKRVAVFAGKGIRNSFETAICLEGKLQQHPTDLDNFRVVIDDGNYSYFRTDDVEMEFPDGIGHTTKSGCHMVFRLVCPFSQDKSFIQM